MPDRASLIIGADEMKARRLASGSAPLLCEQAGHLMALGDDAKAFDTLIQSLQLDPLHPGANALAVRLMMKAPHDQRQNCYGQWRSIITQSQSLSQWAAQIAPALHAADLAYAILPPLSMLAWHDHDHDTALDLLDQAVIPANAATASIQVQDEYGQYDYDRIGLHHASVQSFIDFAAPFLSPGMNIVDAACGSGLAAPALAPFASRLVGIDLSPSMVERAFDCGFYDELIEQDMVQALRSMSGLDAILCIGATYYLADLAPMIQAASTALKPGGVFLFSDYRAPDLLGHGLTVGRVSRHCRSAATIRNLAQDGGFSLLAQGAGLIFNIPCPFWALRRDK